MPLPEYLQSMLDKLNERKNTINKLKLNEEYAAKDYDRDIKAYNDYKNKILIAIAKLQPKLIEKGATLIDEQIELNNVLLQDRNLEKQRRTQEAKNQNPEEANNPLYRITLTDVTTEIIDINKRIEKLNEYKNAENGIKEFVKNKYFQEVGEVNLHTRMAIYARIMVDSGDPSDIESSPEDFADTNFEPLFEFYSNMLGEDEVLNAINKVDLPEFSPALKNYEITGDNDYDLIKGYRSKEFIKEKDDIVRQLANNAKNRNVATVEDFDRYNKAHAEHKKYNSVYINTERNADIIKSLLCGLTAADGERYERRLRAIITIIAKDNRVGNEKFMTMVGVDENLQHDFATATKYVKELMTRTDSFGADTVTYTENVDFDKICVEAIERFDRPETTQEQVENTIAFMGTRGDNFVYDARVIKEMFDGCTTPAQLQNAYAKLIEDASKGNSTLEAFANEKIRTPEKLAELTEYIDRAYAFKAREDSREIGVANIPGVDNPNINVDKDSPLSTRGITPQFIKDKCEENLDGVKTSTDMLRQFISQLNRFSLTAEEHYAIHGFARNEHCKEFEKGTLKEKGLQCHKEDVRLNDAIATYGRLKDIHAKRPFFFFLFHPNQNSKEKSALEYMRNTLKDTYHFTDAELDARVETVKANATDGLNRRFVETSDPERFKNMIAVQKSSEKDRMLTYDMEVAKIESKYERKVPEGMVAIKSNDPKKIIPEIYVEKDVEIEKDYKFANVDDAYQKWAESISIVTQIRFDHADKKTLPMMENMTQEEYRKAAVEAVRQLSKDVGIPQDLKAIVKDEDVDFLSESAMADACRPGNPKDPTLEDIKALYRSLM